VRRQLPRHQLRVGQSANADRNIDTRFDDIEHFVGHDDIDIDLRITVHEVGQVPDHVPAAK
jgi:hypothetical protein